MKKTGHLLKLVNQREKPP